MITKKLDNPFVCRKKSNMKLELIEFPRDSMPDLPKRHIPIPIKQANFMPKKTVVVPSHSQDLLTGYGISDLDTVHSPPIYESAQRLKKHRYREPKKGYAEVDKNILNSVLIKKSIESHLALHGHPGYKTERMYYQ